MFNRVKPNEYKGIYDTNLVLFGLASDWVTKEVSVIPKSVSRVDSLIMRLCTFNMHSIAFDNSLDNLLSLLQDTPKQFS